MAITQNANVLRPDSSAKNGTLGTPGAIAANQIKFDTAITTNNSNLESSPTFLRRHVVIRKGDGDEELNLITGVDVDGVTCTCLDDWDSVPVSGDTYDVAYTMRDMATFSGCTRDATLKFYTMSRQMVVGTAANAGFLGISNAEVVYMDDRGPTAPALQVNAAGRFVVGTTRNDLARRGAILFFTNDADDEEAIDFKSGSVIRLYDFVMASAGRPDGIGGFTVTIGSTDIEWARSKTFGMAAAVFKNTYERLANFQTIFYETVADAKLAPWHTGHMQSENDLRIKNAIASKADGDRIRVLIEEG